MSQVLTVVPPADPARQGFPKVLTVRVENLSDDFVALDRAWTDGPVDEVVSWRRHPEGVFVYDALADRYCLHSVTSVRAAIPLCHALVPPKRWVETFLRLKCLVPGPRRIVVRATGQAFPASEVGRRVYVAPERLQGATTDFLPLTDPAQARGAVVAHLGGAPAFALEATTEVAVDEDRETPAAAALARAGAGSVVVDRCRRLGGAWVVRAADGEIHVVHGERHLACGAIDPAVFTHLDERLPFEPVVVVFKGGPARALRDAGVLPLQGLEAGQQHLPPAAVWDLLAAARERGLRVEVGPYSPMYAGVIVRSGRRDAGD